MLSRTDEWSFGFISSWWKFVTIFTENRENKQKAKREGFVDVRHLTNVCDHLHNGNTGSYDLQIMIFCIDAHTFRDDRRTVWTTTPFLCWMGGDKCHMCVVVTLDKKWICDRVILEPISPNFNHQWIFGVWNVPPFFRHDGNCRENRSAMLHLTISLFQRLYTSVVWFSELG